MGTSGPTDDETGEILAQYIDLVNRHGIGSAETEKFRAEHADNKKFVRLADSVDSVRRQCDADKPD